MRFKTLDIRGFKSFGDKITIHFSEGVTSIVGPNGSGKSNIVDAIRWVLGEQKTRMLRSDKMDNIIFNGTKTRKPAHLTEVSLTFENTRNIIPTEFNDITITRKLYRSGDSEYLINGIVCRLKDITELFLDTGIGSDSYSIIELRMIDDILNDRHDMIRTLFEEAAGISKYKIRKKQTMHRLADTEADLARVNDLLFEVEKNMKAFELQARKTEKYYRLKDKYRDISTQLALKTISGFRESHENLQSESDKLEIQKTKLVNGIHEREALLEREKTQLIEKERALAEMQKKANDIKSVIIEIENENKLKTERLNNIGRRKDELSLASQKANFEIQELLSSLALLNKDVEKEKIAVAAMDAKLTMAKRDVQEHRDLLTSCKEQMELVNKIMVHTRSSLHEFEKNSAIKEERKSAVLESINRLQNELKLLIQNKESSELDIKNTQSAFQFAQSFLVELEKTQKAISDKIHKSEQLLVKIREEHAQENRKLDARKNEYRLTKSLIDNLEGFPESIKFLKKQAPSKVVAPLLSDVINCHTDYKAAIETYLDPFMNYFIADSKEEAWQAIDHLNSASKGRASFFILNKVLSKKPEKPVVPENCIPAINVIESEEKYLALFQILLFNVFIRNGEEKHQLPENPDCVIISSGGKFMSTSNSVSGGSVGLFDGKRIGRSKNLENLEKEIKELESSRDQKHTILDKKQKQLSLEKNELATGLQTVKDAQNKAADLNNNLAALTARQNELNKQIFTSDEKEKELKQVLALLETDSSENSDDNSLKMMSETLSVNIEKHKQLTINANAESENLNNASAIFNQLNIQHIQQQNKINSLIRETGFKQNSCENLNKQLAENVAELEKLQLQTDNLKSNASGSEGKLLQLYEDKEGCQQSIQYAEEQYYSARGKIDVFENEVKDIRKQKENNDVLIQAVHERIVDLKIQLNGLRERLNVEFGIELESLSESDSDGDNSLNIEELKESVEKIKNQISSFGPINPMAVEAFNEIKERFVFINEQKNDLIKAKELLLETIGEIDHTAKEQFMDAFVKVRENFIDVFRSLFSDEDSCDLLLANPSDPLESDIQIFAQPKGKRPLSINQLSGGEKTLTAIALLFAIYLWKPAPFCIFDEVDAPLDDNNIDKFIKIIKTFSTRSQFIIVTHNKRTMAATDVIYGITMVEQGVTQVVPVDLREFAQS